MVAIKFFNKWLREKKHWKAQSFPYIKKTKGFSEKKKKFKIEDFDVELQKDQWKIFKRWQKQYMESEKEKYKS